MGDTEDDNKQILASMRQRQRSTKICLIGDTADGVRLCWRANRKAGILDTPRCSEREREKTRDDY